MGVNIKLKRSAVPGKIPTTSSLDLGEVAVNTYDGKLFFKKDDGSQSIIEIANASGSIASASYAENAGLLDGFDSSNFIFSSSFNNYTSSQNNLNGTFATTGSNQFNGNQSISGSLIVSASSRFNSPVYINGDETSPFLNYGYLSISGSSGSRIDLKERDATTTLVTYENTFLIISPTGSARLSFPEGNIALQASRSIFLSSGNVTASNDMSIGGGLLVGATGFTPLSNETLIVDGKNSTSFNLITARSNTDNYSQFNIQNQNSGSNASTDIVATNNIGTEGTYYVDLGINGSNFTGEVGGPNDAYLYTTGSNLLIGNLTNDKDISLFTTGNGKINITGSLLVTGSITTTGALTAQTLVVETITSSVIYSSGSNNFGNNLSNTQTFTGSVLITGSGFINGNEILTNASTGSLVTYNDFNNTTASLNSFSASILAFTSSQNNLNGTFATTGSNTFVGNQIVSGNIYFANSSSIYTNNAYDVYLKPNVSGAAALLSQDESHYVLVSYNGTFANDLTVSGFLKNNNFRGTGSLQGTASFADTASNILGGKATHFPYFNTDTTLATSSIYQSGSFSVIINQDNATSANPEALYVWQPSTSINVISGKGNLDNYLQLNIQNVNQGVSASSDVVATANNGNENSNYIDMGINSENYASGFVGEANDAYLYSTGRHLHIGNVSNFPVQLFAGGSDSTINTKLSLYPDNNHELSGSLAISGSINVFNGITGSLFGSASYSNNTTSASYALTASYVANASSFPYTGSAVITGSLIVTGSLEVTNGITGSLFGTSSYALTASYALNANNSGNAITAYTQSVPSDNWIFVHNLNVSNPIVNVYNSQNQSIIPQEITLTNSNTVTVTFPLPITGKIVVAGGSFAAVNEIQQTISSIIFG